MIGEILRPQGLRGAVRVRPLTDRPERFERVTECVLWDAASDERETRRVITAQPQGQSVVMALDGCESIEAAEGLVGRLVALPEAEALPLAPGQFYPWQLEGAKVVTEDGQEVGRVAGIEQSTGHDLWVVRRGEREHLIPAVAAIVVDVDVAAGRVVIRPPEGLLDL